MCVEGVYVCVCARSCMRSCSWLKPHMLHAKPARAFPAACMVRLTEVAVAPALAPVAAAHSSCAVGVASLEAEPDPCDPVGELLLGGRSLLGAWLRRVHLRDGGGEVVLFAVVSGVRHQPAAQPATILVAADEHEVLVR